VKRVKMKFISLSHIYYEIDDFGVAEIHTLEFSPYSKRMRGTHP